VILLKGSSLLGAIFSCLQVLVLMEISYLAGLFVFSLWGHIHKRRKKNSIADRSQVTGKHPHG
jgi:hypothetical protein